jgi:hypothetical protein
LLQQQHTMIKKRVEKKSESEKMSRHTHTTRGEF